MRKEGAFSTFSHRGHFAAGTLALGWFVVGLKTG